MSENPSCSSLKLDPWAASSLLQKAIRRGKVELAQAAARALYRQRGEGVFRRLCTIAVEDIGIADMALVQEVARIGTDKALRTVLGSDTELMEHLCSRMADATKDRSADYLYCAATKLESAIAERSELGRLPCNRLISLASDDALPLMRRANAALLACASDGGAGPAIDASRVSNLLDAFPVKALPLHDAVLQLSRVRAHPFCLMLPLIWSRWWEDGAKSEVVEDEAPITEFIYGVPLYTFDRHTAAGKQAIARLVRENDDVAAALRMWVSESRSVDVAEIAAFYSDAAPVARRLDWPTGSLLAKLGLFADMMHSGCTFDGVQPVIETVYGNLPHLNRLRRKACGMRVALRK